VSEPDCVFCRIVAGELPAHKIYEDEHAIAFMDINPATRGHALVIPRKHARDLLEIEDSEIEATIIVAQRVAARMCERLGAKGINIINSCGQVAWQTVFHFHLHVIPRYEGDSMRLPWTPSAGNQRDVAEAAQALL
jgi:histidine triad (HIT) family protein